MGEKGRGVMRALTTDEFSLLCWDGESDAVDVRDSLAAHGFLVSAAPLREGVPNYCVTDAGNRARRIHETFLGIRSGT